MHPSTEFLIQAALAEDLGQGDLTALFFVTEASQSRATLNAREPGILSGLEVALRVFECVDPNILVHPRLQDGQAFEKGTVLMDISGPTRGMLSAERTALNFLQRLSGIATQTHRYTEAVKPYPVQIWDTRKTTPGWRLLEKAAVKHGGGTNHRMGLYDHVMVKDNHLMADSDLTHLQASIDALKKAHPEARVQLECDRLSQVKKFLTLDGVEMLLLDNMKCEMLHEAVQMVNGRLWLEASGGITLETISQVAATGVNAISVGALTHSVRALDLGLDFL
jgi:nicotinate-nucleotide pyrophosphorylase (carboxylating)